MNNWYNNKMFLGGVLIVVLIIGAMLISKNRGNDAEPEVTTAALEAGPVEVTGTIACLPYSNGDEDEECVKGLKGDDNRYYALNTVTAKGVEKNMGQGEEVVVKGTYQPADTTSEESSVFVYSGVIVVTSIEEKVEVEN